MKRYIFYCDQLTADEYESLYQSLDRYSFMTIASPNRIIDAYWDNNEPLEEIVKIPSNCHYSCS